MPRSTAIHRKRNKKAKANKLRWIKAKELHQSSSKSLLFQDITEAISEINVNPTEMVEGPNEMDVKLEAVDYNWCDLNAIKVEENETVGNLTTQQEVTKWYFEDAAYQLRNIKQEQLDIKDELPDTYPRVDSFVEKPFVCSKVDEKSNSLNSTQTHTERKLNVCSVCEYNTAYKSNLVQHMATHTGEKPYSCSVCDYKTAFKTNLVQHMATHTGEKPYLCSVCDYKTAYKTNLVQHMVTHTDKKPYSCFVCEFKTAYKWSHVRHMGTHTGEKQNSCSVCEFKTVQKSSLVRHMRTHRRKI